MPKALKWTLIIPALLILCIAAALVIVPRMIDLQRYKPQIESRASQALGRPVKVHGRIQPALFPWAGVAVHGVRIGNPPGFGSEPFATIELLEIRIRLWPLLRREYQVQRFVLKSPQITLVKLKGGRANWQGLGEQGPSAAAPAQSAPGTPISQLAVAEMKISDGSLHYVDQAAGTRHALSALQLHLTDLSPIRPVKLELSAMADGWPIQLSGTLGPLGSEPGKDPLDFKLQARLFKRIEMQLQGRLEQLQAAPRGELNLQVASFSLRALAADLKRPLPLTAADPKALTKAALSLKLSGTLQKITSKGDLTLDDSLLHFAATVRDFSRPDLQIEADLDRIDLDRYLPPSSRQQSTPAEASPASPQKSDHSGLRRLVLDGHFKVGELKVKNVRTRNLVLKADAKNGIIHIDPLDLALYDGRMFVKSTIDVRSDRPRTQADLTIAKVKAGPLLKDLIRKEAVEGLMNGSLSLQMAGDSAEQVRRTLSGQGEITLSDGALVGIDLPAMVRNVQSAFDLMQSAARKPRTDFSELRMPFTVNQGVVRLKDARLVSPLLQVSAAGQADLARETLDMRLEPRFLAGRAGNGDPQQYAGIMVPVLVGGTFDNPLFLPDLKAILRQKLPDRDTLKKVLPPKQDLEKGLEQKALDLLKGLQK